MMGLRCPPDSALGAPSWGPAAQAVGTGPRPSPGNSVLAGEFEIQAIGLEALALGERDHFGFAQHLDADDILAAEFLALDDPVIDRPMGLAQELRGLAGEARADRGDELLGQGRARERADRSGAAGLLAPARDGLLADAVFFGELAVGLGGRMIREIGRANENGHCLSFLGGAATGYARQKVYLESKTRESRVCRPCRRRKAQ